MFNGNKTLDGEHVFPKMPSQDIEMGTAGQEQALRRAAMALVEKYNEILTQLDSPILKSGPTTTQIQNATWRLEVTPEYKNFMAAACVANPSLRRNHRGPITYKKDLKLYGDSLNGFIAGSVTKAIEAADATGDTAAEKRLSHCHIPEPFESNERSTYRDNY